MIYEVKPWAKAFRHFKVEAVYLQKHAKIYGKKFGKKMRKN